MSFPGGSDGKASACYAGVLGLILGSGRSSGEENGNPFQYSCLENSTDGGAWQAIVCGIAKSRTQLSNFTFFYFIILMIRKFYVNINFFLYDSILWFICHNYSLILYNNNLSKFKICYMPVYFSFQLTEIIKCFIEIN